MIDKKELDEAVARTKKVLTSHGELGHSKNDIRLLVEAATAPCPICFARNPQYFEYTEGA